VTDGPQWLEAHRDKPLRADWYIERDAESVRKLAEQSIEPAEIGEAEPMPVEVEPYPGREGAWLVIYSPSFTRIVDRQAVAGARVEDDDRRLVIQYGRRRFVLSERDDG
jgi:hypothetical protein